MNTWTFKVPGFVPVNQNDTVGRHWSVKHKMLKQATEVLYAAALTHRIPFVSYRKPAIRHVSATFAGWIDGRTMPDPDNLLKYFLDAMVAAGLLVDDKPEWCSWDKPLLIRSSMPSGTFTIRDTGYGEPFARKEDLPHEKRLIGAMTRKINKSKGPNPLGNRAARRARRKGKAI